MLSNGIETRQRAFLRYNGAVLSVRALALPSLLNPEDLAGHVAVVFDVLRATTTMAAALSAGATMIRVYGTLDDARAAVASSRTEAILAGEQHTLRPADFDLGNTPADFTPDVCHGRPIVMATTNGTRALVAAQMAEVLLTGSIANATATAAAVRQTGLPVTLIGSGTQGEVSLEDLLGCGAVIDALETLLPDAVSLDNDTALLARTLWQCNRNDLPAVFRRTFSGHNLRRSNLLDDVDFCAVPDRYPIACRVTYGNGRLVVGRWQG